MSGKMGAFRKTQQGFTLVELLVVVAILAILSSVAVVGVTQFVGSGSAAANSTEVQTVQSAIDLYMADAGLDTLPAGEVESTGTDQFGTGSTLDLYPAYLRQNPTRCEYTWTSGGVVSQVDNSCD